MLDPGTLNWKNIPQRGHSQTTWTRFWPFLTTHLPHVDKHGHFLDHLPMSTWTFMYPPPSLYFRNGPEIDGVNICLFLCHNWSNFKISFSDKKWELEIVIHEFCHFWPNYVIFAILFPRLFDILSMWTFGRAPTYLAWTIVDIWLTTHPPHLVHVVCEWTLPRNQGNLSSKFFTNLSRR